MRLVTQTDLIANRIGDEECVRMLARAGFDAIDWSFFEMTEGKGIWCTDGWREHALALRAAADEAGVGFSQAHAPFPSSNGTLPFDEVIVQRIVRSMEVASVLGVKNIVVHPKQHLYYPKNQQQLFDENVAFYKELMPHAQRLNITVCTENMWQRDVNRDYIIGSVCAPPPAVPLAVYPPQPRLPPPLPPATTRILERFPEPIASSVPVIVAMCVAPPPDPPSAPAFDAPVAPPL